MVSIYSLTLRKKNSRFNEFIQAREHLPQMQKLLLQSYLIEPIQRIPRYELLFKELLKHTPDDHPDKPNLEKALQKTKQSASYVNEERRKAESYNKMMELTSKVKGLEGLYHEKRVFIREGALRRVKNANNLRVCQCYLFSNLLVLVGKVGRFKLKGDGGLEVKAYVVLNSKVEVKELEDTPGITNAFEIVAKQGADTKVVILSANSKVDKMSWASDIMDNINDSASDEGTIFSQLTRAETFDDKN